MDKLTELKGVIGKELSNYFENTDLFLVEVNVLLNNKIEIFADGKANITIDKCAEISRYIGAFLEENGLVGEKYTLEVSSPGMDQPLKVSQQFEKQKGKEVDVVLKKGTKITGTLTDFDTDKITVNEKIKKIDLPAGQAGKTEAEMIHSLNFDEIKSVKKHFNFK